MSLFRRRFTSPGAPPGTVVESASAHEPRFHLLRYGKSDCEEFSWDSIEDIPELTQAERVTWLDVRGLGSGTLVLALGERLGLHHLAVSDVLNLGQRPKVEAYGDHVFVVLWSLASSTDGHLQWEQVSLFLGKGHVVSFQETSTDLFASVRERIRTGRSAIRGSGSDYLACMLIDTIVDGYFPLLEQYGARLEDLEEEILEGPRGDVLERLYLMKREQASFRRAAWPMRDAMAQLMRDADLPFSKASRVYLRDTQDHVMQIVEVAESFRDLSAGLIDVHLSIVGQKTNDVMRVLTVVATLFIPHTFVAGVYGMNFDTSQPANLPELGWRYGYLFFWVLCAALATVLLVLFRRLGWLGARER